MAVAGNLRELSNLVEYLVNVVPPGEVIDISLLPPNFARHAAQMISGTAAPVQNTGIFTAAKLPFRSEAYLRQQRMRIRHCTGKPCWKRWKNR